LRFGQLDYHTKWPNNIICNYSENEIDVFLLKAKEILKNEGGENPSIKNPDPNLRKKVITEPSN
jgi:hypothetical protein